MSFIATAIIGGAVLGAGASIYASGKASDAISSSSAQATDTQLRMFNTARSDLAPWRDVGEDALAKIKQVFINGDMSGFKESADYQFNLEQGEQALERKQSAAGSRYGGSAIKESLRYAQGLASNEYSGYFDRLFKTANMGEAAAAQQAANATSTGQSISGQQMATGTNLANTTMAGAAGVNNAVQGGIGNLVTLKMYNDMVNTIPSTPTSTWV